MILKVIAYLALVLTIVPPFMFLADSIEVEAMKNVMIVGFVMWFATAPFGFKDQKAS